MTHATAADLDDDFGTLSELSPSALRVAYSSIPSAVAVLAAGEPDADASRLHGMTVATIVPVSLDPPYLGVFIQTGSRTWSHLCEAPAIGVNVLSANQNDIAQQIARSDQPARFAGVGVSWPTRSTALRVDECLSWFEVVPESSTEAGDHIFALLRVLSGQIPPRGEPAVFFRSTFRNLRNEVLDGSAFHWDLGEVWQ